MSTLKVAKVESPDTSTGGIAIDSGGDVQVATNFEVATIKDTSGNNSSTTEQINQGRAKAWVNFNGTGTVAIRHSFNVSSITDNGLGDYSVNFTTAMSDTNYAVAGSAKRSGTGAADMFMAVKQSASYDSHSTTSIDVMARFDNAQAGDSDAVSVIIFGD